ncbi:MAG: dephospho-CoA kinase [Synergistaceae bacterium]|nr:dephospho-CoA kinase [Synergistaceae bacterium]
MLIIGLTGDVGAGKSTLCGVWREMGADVIDADTIARDMWKLPEVRSKAEARWGEGFFDDEWKTVLDRIAAKIFCDDEEYEFASGLLHSPAIIEVKRRIDRSGASWVAAEIPLLYECGVPDWIDCVVYAAAPLEKRAERNKRRGWDVDEILRRENKMMPREEKIRRADWVIENIGTEEEWRAKARELGRFFIEKCEKERGK